MPLSPTKCPDGTSEVLFPANHWRDRFEEWSQWFRHHSHGSYWMPERIGPPEALLARQLEDCTGGHPPPSTTFIVALVPPGSNPNP